MVFRQAFAKEEMSYISQLINGKSSFGEKAATRLESDYGMPPCYLSQPFNDDDDSPLIAVSNKQEEKLIKLFRELLTLKRAYGCSL